MTTCRRAAAAQYMTQSASSASSSSTSVVAFTPIAARRRSGLADVASVLVGAVHPAADELELGMAQHPLDRGLAHTAGCPLDDSIHSGMLCRYDSNCQKVTTCPAVGGQRRHPPKGPTGGQTIVASRGTVGFNRARRRCPGTEEADMKNMTGTSSAVLVGSALTVGSLIFASPAAAHPGHAGGGEPSAHFDGGSQAIRAAELPIAPVGTAGPGRVPMTPSSPADPGSYPSVAHPPTVGTAELPIAPVGTAGPGRVPMTSVVTSN